MEAYSKVGYSLLLLLTAFFFSSTPLFAAEKWELAKDEEDVKVYVRPYPHNPSLNECKGVITVPVPIAVAFAAIMHTPNHHLWVHKVYEASALEPWQDGRLVHYFSIEVPFPFSNRDVIYETRTHLEPVSRTITAASKVVKGDRPIKEGNVRINDSENTWIIKEIGPQETRVTYRNYSNPGGAVPSFIAKLVSEDMPYNTLLNLRKLVSDPKYEELAAEYQGSDYLRRE